MNERVSTSGKAGHGQVLYGKGDPGIPRSEQTCRFLGYVSLCHD